MTHISVAITSCGRIKLLKKTISSLEKSCDISNYKKILTEDSKNKKIIEKIKKENKTWFLKWWKIIFTWWIWNTNEEKHFNALEKLYQEIKTDYVFHLEDDWFFKKTNFDFLKFSKKILEKNKNVWIIQLRDFDKDWWYNHIQLNKNDRKIQLFEKNSISLGRKSFLKFRNDETWDNCKWFSLNPGLRRTKEMKEIMFWTENITQVDEILFWEKMKHIWLFSLKLEPWICYHIWNSFLSTKILEKWFFAWIGKTFIGTYNYRIKTLLIERRIKPLFIKLYQKLDLFSPTRYLMDIVSYLKRRNSIAEITENELTNIEWIKEMNIPISWFTEKKPLWISWVARLKNGDDFLEKVIESHIHFLDEIILVDNQSIDNTREICLKLQKKYPEKIKFFEYNYDVYPPWTEECIASNSIHSLAYYYNWCFSKTKYQYVMKLDDDNLFLAEKWQKLRKYILKNRPNKYLVYWWYNLIKDKKWKKWIPINYKYSGKYWDHWIYKVSKQTYYIQWKYFEEFKNNLFYMRNGFSFFHLKFLKKQFWFSNLRASNYTKEYKNKIHTKILTNLTDFFDKKIIDYLNNKL